MSKNKKNKMGGIILLISSFIVAFFFIVAGGTMMGIQSISGDSIAEAFYRAMGLFSIALGFLVIWLGVAFCFIMMKDLD
jgi:Na+(H+)/acetate symporter ActP